MHLGGTLRPLFRHTAVNVVTWSIAQRVLLYLCRRLRQRHWSSRGRLQRSRSRPPKRSRRSRCVLLHTILSQHSL